MALTTNIAKQRSDDRILVLEPIDGKAAKSSTGLVDPRLFNGENKLHAYCDPETRMWNMKYERGGLPDPLKGTFTTFKTLIKFTEDYFNKRNIKIKEIID